MNDIADTVKPDFRRLSDRAALYQEAAAERLGINPTDLRCLSLVIAEPGITASRVAELSGLTTGAVTGILDRLERAHLARRDPDPADRRRTLVQPLPDRSAEIAAVYGPLDDAVGELLRAYGPEEQRVVGEFVTRATTAVEDETARLRAHTRGGFVGEMFTAPRGEVTVARLKFESGAARLSRRWAPLGPDGEARMVAELARTSLALRSGDLDQELARGTFTGPMPDVLTRDGVVMVRYRRRLDWRQHSAAIGLSTSVPWVIEVGGGLSALTAELGSVLVRAISIRGGVEKLDMRLPSPDGTSRLTLSGGAADVTLTHPPGTFVRLAVKGGIHDARFGGERLRQVYGDLRIETPGAASAPDRWEIEMTGGVRTLSVIEG